MKRIILIFLCLIFAFSGCMRVPQGEIEPTTHLDKIETDKADEWFVGVWLTYSELSVKGKNYTEESYREYVAGLFGEFSERGITDVFLHVRPFSDALYYSSLFESSEYSSGERGKKADFDILRISVEEGKKQKLKIHAWINPYRVLTTPDVSLLTDGQISRFVKEKDSAVAICDEGVYLNPASDKAQRLIVDGIKEILLNYEVDGIHFDDYFYPVSFGDGDKKEYEKYLKDGGRLSLENFRREKVSSLILFSYSTVKSHNENLTFSVSPSGDIEKNINESYADVPLWCKGGYCDMIIPQLYFGFENESKPFSEELSRWLQLTEKTDVKLVPGLALYKVGEEDEFAGKGKNEWKERIDVIERQIDLAKETGCYGVSFFSAGYISKLNLK